MRRAGLALALAMLVAAAWIAVKPGTFARAGAYCDGDVPAWYPSEGGCTEVPSLLEHLWPPERWGAPRFCQAMCASITEVEEQMRVVTEWREAHPDAMAHPEIRSGNPPVSGDRDNRRGPGDVGDGTTHDALFQFTK